jgi:hypothetical protein
LIDGACANFDDEGYRFFCSKFKVSSHIKIIVSSYEQGHFKQQHNEECLEAHETFF